MCADQRRHRGAHPQDQQLFAARHHAVLRQAVADLSWLLSKDYAPTAALKLVGDHFALKDRQRLAVARAACADAQKIKRQQTSLPLAAIAGQHLLLDGFNLIITVEAALSGGVLLACRDDCLRDLASVNGSYRAISETAAAIDLLSQTLLTAAPASATWLLDQPISNSGRLAQRIRELAAAHGWPWQVQVVMNPDKLLGDADGIIITSDSNILDAAKSWINLPALLVKKRLPQAWIIDLSGV